MPKPLISYKKAIEIYKQGGDSHQLELAASMSNLGAVHYAQQHYDKAKPLFEQAIEIREHELGQGSQRSGQ